MIENRKILVAVSGSIAIYKVCDLIRAYIKAGAHVKVVMSDAAMKFITPLTFEALTRQKVLTSQSENWSSELNHIDYAKWADVMVVAPATANTINKLSKGIADNLLAQTFLACKAKKIIAPSANTAMLEDENTIASLKMLRVLGCTIVEPQNKLLACGDVGKGALAEVVDIFDESVKTLNIDPFFEDRKVIVTSGGGKERIDDVRYISNFSSGKMGASIAKWLYYKGADVFYLSFTQNRLPSGVHTLKVESSAEMEKYLIDAIRVAKKGKLSKVTLQSAPQRLIQKKPMLFMVAAVSDYRPKFPQRGKLKKEVLGASWSLELVENKDLLRSIDKDGITVIGFKAEFDATNAKSSAQKMLQNKKLDAVCLNILSSNNGFGSDENEIYFIAHEKELFFKKQSKDEIAQKILQSCKDL